MKKKNIIKNSDGTRSYKNENLWMHSIDRPVKHSEEKGVYIAFAIIAVIFIAIVVFSIIVG